MAEPLDRHGSISRPVLVAIVISIVALALVAALVWRPLARSLHLALVPTPMPGGHRSVIREHAVAASPARAP